MQSKIYWYVDINNNKIYYKTDKNKTYFEKDEQEFYYIKEDIKYRILNDSNKYTLEIKDSDISKLSTYLIKELCSSGHINNNTNPYEIRNIIKIE